MLEVDDSTSTTRERVIGQINSLTRLRVVLVFLALETFLLPASQSNCTLPQ